MIYAQIKNNKIMNTIVVDSSTPLALFSEGYDALLRIDDKTPVPGIGWNFDQESFTPPIIESEQITE